jgi:hypothetical protein
MTTRGLEPDRDQIEIFVDAVLRYRGTKGFISLRSFVENDDEAPPYRKLPISLKGDFKFLVDCAVDDARRAAQAPQPVVFAPPLAVFNNKDHAREEDVLAGLVLSVECDRAASLCLYENVRRGCPSITHGAQKAHNSPKGLTRFCSDIARLFRPEALTSRN